MIQKVLNETPFQVLSDTFSISPSTTGYQLQVSANGKDYSTLFSVGAGVTRMCTGMANGSFYRLLGNEGEVEVNWRTTCKSGSGGGSGSGSTVVVNQILSAGTQIASIQVDNQTTTLYAPEGGQGGGDYQVVSQLPASAETGQLFYVPAHSGTTTLSGWEIYDIADNTLVGSVVVGFEEEGDIYEVFIDVETGEGGNFTLNGDQIGTSNTFREMGSFDDRVDLIAKCDGEGHCWIYLITPGDERRFDFSPEEETATIEDSTYDYPGEIIPAATYRYLDGQFVLETLPVASQNTLGAVKIGSGITVDSAGTISVEGGQGGGIQKVNELPATAEEGDMVWLEGKTLTGYTILVKEEARPGYVYETSADYYSIDNEDISDSPGYYNIGQWSTRLSNGQTGIMIRSRVQTGTDYPLFDIIDLEGTHTIGVGPDGVSITSGVSFPMKGCLYVYEDGEWFRKPTFEHIYQNATDGADIFNKIQYSIEEFGLEDFVMRYNPNIPTDMREFVPYRSCYFGIDFQAIDSRRRDIEWGKISVVDYRLSANGTFQDIVGEHWIVSEDQINIPQIVSVNINSAGTITEAYGLELLSSMFNVSNRVCFHCNLEADNKFSSAPLKWWYRQNEEVDGDTKLVYYACAEIPIEGTVYRGIWKWVEYEYPDPFVPQSWTVVQ